MARLMQVCNGTGESKKLCPERCGATYDRLIVSVIPPEEPFQVPKCQRGDKIDISGIRVLNLKCRKCLDYVRVIEPGDCPKGVVFCLEVLGCDMLAQPLDGQLAQSQTAVTFCRRSRPILTL